VPVVVLREAMELTPLMLVIREKYLGQVAQVLLCAHQPIIFVKVAKVLMLR